jgi:hypothetical protein
MCYYRTRSGKVNRVPRTINFMPLAVYLPGISTLIGSFGRNTVGSLVLPGEIVLLPKIS